MIKSVGDFLVNDLQRNVVLVLGGVENLESRELASEERLTQSEKPSNSHHETSYAYLRGSFIKTKVRMTFDFVHKTRM